MGFCHMAKSQFYQGIYSLLLVLTRSRDDISLDFSMALSRNHKRKLFLWWSLTYSLRWLTSFLTTCVRKWDMVNGSDRIKKGNEQIKSEAKKNHTHLEL